jgi:hypothetical protein
LKGVIDGINHVAEEVPSEGKLASRDELRISTNLSTVVGSAPLEVVIQTPWNSPRFWNLISHFKKRPCKDHNGTSQTKQKAPC